MSSSDLVISLYTAGYPLKCLHTKRSEETKLKVHWGQGRLQCCAAKSSHDVSQGMWVSFQQLYGFQTL